MLLCVFQEFKECHHCSDVIVWISGIQGISSLFSSCYCVDFRNLRNFLIVFMLLCVFQEFKEFRHCSHVIVCDCVFKECHHCSHHVIVCISGT